MLAQHLHSIIMFQRFAINSGYGWHRFVKTVDRAMPKRGNTSICHFQREKRRYDSSLILIVFLHGAERGLIEILVRMGLATQGMRFIDRILSFCRRLPQFADGSLKTILRIFRVCGLPFLNPGMSLPSRVP
jgi:hypothetical protein